MSGNKENSLSDFEERFVALMDEARSYGVDSVVLLHENDPLAEHCTRVSLWRGSSVLAMGLVETMRVRLQQHLFADSDV